MLDLKGKVQVTEEKAENLLTHDNVNDTNDGVVKEAILALEALGYSKRELNKVEKSLSKETCESVDEAVKRGLQLLVS